MKTRLLLLAALLLAASCKQAPQVHQIRNLGSTPYQEDSIRMTYGRNPERALVLLDSAVLLGNIDPYRALLTRATIYSRSPEIRRLDQAETLCQSLLQHDSVVGVPQRQSAVLDLLLRDRARAARALGRPEEAYGYMQRYAALNSELANKLQESRVM